MAATDASGRVWVAWQAFRNNNLEILAAAQKGDRFTARNNCILFQGERLGSFDRDVGQW